MLSFTSIACQLILQACNTSAILRAMPKGKTSADKAGSWVFRDIPRDLMHRIKVAAAIERKSVKQLLMELAEAHLDDLERKGMLPKGKG
jgi:hypothetical protein